MADEIVAGGAVEPLSMSGIYVIRCKPTGKIYVGSSARLGNRWNLHKRLLRRGQHHSAHLQNAWSKHGEGAFSFEVLEVVQPEDLLPVEQRYIDELQACDKLHGFNIAPTAGSRRGVKMRPFTQEHKDKIGAANKGRVISAEQRAKQSATMTGRPGRNKGWVPSDETRKKISAAHKGKRLSAEHRTKIGMGGKGKPKSAEMRRKVSLALKGRKPSPQTYAAAVALSRKFSDDDVVLIRQRLADKVMIVLIAREFGCHPNTISELRDNKTRAYGCVA